MGKELCDLFDDDESDPTRWVVFMDMDFNAADFEEGLSRLDWGLRSKGLELPERGLVLKDDIERKTRTLRHLYARKLARSDGFKDPIAHMNALMKANEKIPDDFHRRYGLIRGETKALWLATPTFEERLCRERIAAAVVRKGNRSGHYIYMQRRLKLSDEDTKRLVDDMWENPDKVSKIFYELFDWERLIEVTLTEAAQTDVRRIQAQYGTVPE